MNIENNYYTDFPINIFFTNEYLHINTFETGNLKVYNSKGNLILEKKIKIGKESIKTTSLNPGLYIINFRNKTKNYSQKIINLF